MKKEKSIFDQIDDMYNLKDDKGNQKNKAFFSHLIRAYVPLKSVKVALKNPEQKKGERRINVHCVFSKKKLITAEGVMRGVNSDSFKNNLDEFLKSFDKEKGVFTSTTPMHQLLNGRVLALQGIKTKTYMSQESYLAFINWVMTKYLAGDSEIKYLLNTINKNPFHPGIPIKKKEEKVYSSTTKLGNFSVLQELKEKFKEEEKNDNDN